VTASNLLDLAEMTRLRGELDQAVAQARDRPETALGVLAEIWNRMTDRAEFLLKDSRSSDGERHRRPKILPERPKKAAAGPARGAG
jgi:hypothetical protein